MPIRLTLVARKNVVDACGAALIGDDPGAPLALNSDGRILRLSDSDEDGDFDEDGGIDGLDFLLWQRDPNVGSLAVWEANYGTTSIQPGDFDATEK